MNNYQKEIETLYKELETSELGLTTKEVEVKQNQYGYNELPKKKEKGILQLFLEQFANPMELILVGTVILSYITGEIVDACTLAFIILVDVVLGAYEEYRALKDADSLLNLIKTTCKAIRNRETIEVEAKELVPGDIVLLESGDKISFDGRILESKNLTTNESSLTGESNSIAKEAKTIKKDTPLAERKNMVYAGTSVMTGRATVLVVATGSNTEIGAIATKVAEGTEEKSPLTIRIEKLTKQITILILVIALITTIILLARGYETTAIIISVIALSVSAMPEGLPLALTMSLTIASKRMLKKHVLVKKLNAVEALGSCSVIATDKTGTLTLNEQTAKKIVLADGTEFFVSGTGYNGIGTINYGNNPKTKVNELVKMGVLNNEAMLVWDGHKWISHGDSIDRAFLALGYKAKIGRLPKQIDRIPYESENQYSVVYFEEEDNIIATMKGSLEKVATFSKENELLFKKEEELCKEGYRVLALAKGTVKSTLKKDLNNLELLGLVAFIDPIRKGVKTSIEECKNAGIKVIMITGDNPITAFSIAKELHICKDETQIATGKDIEKALKLSQEGFDAFVKNKTVFARVTSLHKLYIVEALKRLGEFVAVTGDGVNDAPAIQSAHIGISMGTGTDVAKETADMILTDDKFTSIVAGIKEGRVAYNNIRKILLFLLACGVAEVAFFLLAIVFGYDVPLLAIQLLWLNVVTDGLQDIALSFEKEDDSCMKEPVRSTKESIFNKALIKNVLVIGATITLVVFGSWKVLLDQGVDTVYARSFILMLMVWIQNLNVLNARSEKKSIFAKGYQRNFILWFCVIGCIILNVFMTEIPFLSRLLNIAPLKGIDLLIIIGLSTSILIVSEVYKGLQRK